MMRGWMGVTVLMGTLIAAPSEAAPITFTFSGVLNAVPAALAGNFASGDLLTGTFTIESSTPPRAGSTATQAVFDAVTSVSFTLGSYSAGASGSPAGEIQIDNDLPGFNDRYALVTDTARGLSGPTVGGFAPLAFGFRLDDTTNTVFNTALVLPTSLSMASFTSGSFFFFVSGPSVELLSGQITSVQAVPEPATAVLVGLGLAAARMVRRRHRA